MAGLTGIDMLKVSNGNTKDMLNLFKVNNKNTRTTSMMSFWGLYC